MLTEDHIQRSSLWEFIRGGLERRERLAGETLRVNEPNVIYYKSSLGVSDFFYLSPMNITLLLLKKQSLIDFNSTRMYKISAKV